MSDRTCPNCAQLIKEGSSTCSCGFASDDGVDVPSPEIVRTASRKPSAVERLESEEPTEPARKAGAPRSPRGALSALDEDIDLPPLPWETGGETTPPRPGSQKTTSTETLMPRVTDDPADTATETAGVIPPTAARYQQHTTSVRTPTTTTITPAKASPVAASSRAETGTSPARQPRTALLMDCPACGVRISKRAETCPKCSSAPWDHCQICATRILVNSATCPECGDPTPFDAAAG